MPSNTVKISRSELTTSNGWAVLNSRNPNTGYTPLLSATPWPASLLYDLAQEEETLGYSASYKTKSAELRNKKTQVWVSQRGLSVGRPHAFHGITKFESNLDKWCADQVYVKEQISEMGLPTLGMLPNIDWTTTLYAKPGQMMLNLMTFDRELVARVSKTLLGFEATDAQIEYARFWMDQNSSTAWSGVTPGAQTAVADSLVGTPGTFTFSLMSVWGGGTFVFRFKNLPVEPQVLAFSQEFNIINWNGGQDIYNDVLKCKTMPVHHRLNSAWIMHVRRPMWSYLDTYQAIGVDAPINTRGRLRHDEVSAWANNFNWSAEFFTGRPPGGMVKVYQDEQFALGEFASFGNIEVGLFYVCGVQPFFKGIHVMGDVVWDQPNREIKINQRRWALTWEGQDLQYIKDDLTTTQKQQLENLRIVSVFNLEGAWVAPNNPLYNLGVWQDAQEADMNLENEVFAPASDDNPQITFKQANTRASLKQVNLIHQMMKTEPREDIAKVKVMGTLGSYYAVCYDSAGALKSNVESGTMLLAIRRGASVVFDGEAASFPEQAFFGVFGCDQFNALDDLNSHKAGTGTDSELDESVLFGDVLPTLTPEDADLHTRSAFALVSFSPERKNMHNIAASAMVMISQLRNRMVA